MRKAIFFFLLISSWISLRAQEQEIIKFLDDFRVSQGIHNPAAGIISSYERIQGSPYLFPDYREAVIVMNDGSRYHGKIRYDLYTDEMEFQVQGKTYWITPREGVRKIVLDGKTFIFLKTKGNKKGGFYELVVDGPCRLLGKHLITFKESEEAKPYQDPKPPRFENKKTIYYLKKEGEPSVLVRNKKSVLNYLQDKSGEISNYLRKNHLSLTRPEDLKKMVTYYNSLVNPQAPSR